VMITVIVIVIIIKIIRIIIIITIIITIIIIITCFGGPAGDSTPLSAFFKLHTTIQLFVARLHI